MDDILNIETGSTTIFIRSAFPILVRGLQITISAALLGFVIAVVLGLVFAVMMRVKTRFVTWPLGLFLEFVRDTPLLIQLFFIYYILPSYGIIAPAFLTGAIAIGVQYSAYMAEVYRAGIEAIEQSQWEAATALNLSRRQTYCGIIIPQVVPRIIPATGNYLVGMLKETPILATISVLEMLNYALIIGDRTYQYSIPLTMAGLLMLFVTSIFSGLVRVVEFFVPQDGVAMR